MYGLYSHLLLTSEYISILLYFYKQDSIIVFIVLTLYMFYLECYLNVVILDIIFIVIQNVFPLLK